MNLYCIKCLILERNRSIKIKCEIDRKINLYSCCISIAVLKSLKLLINKKLVIY